MSQYNVATASSTDFLFEPKAFIKHFLLRVALSAHSAVPTPPGLVSNRFEEFVMSDKASSRLVLKLSPGPGQPFFSHAATWKRERESIYVSHCNTLTAFGAKSYCRYCQLGWVRFTSDLFLAISVRISTDCLPGFFRVDSYVRKPEHDSAGIHVRLRQKTKEFFRKM